MILTHLLSAEARFLAPTYERSPAFSLGRGLPDTSDEPHRDFLSGVGVKRCQFSSESDQHFDSGMRIESVFSSHDVFGGWVPADRMLAVERGAHAHA